MSGPVQALLQWRRGRRFRRFIEACQAPEAAQEWALGMLQRLQGGTRYSREVGAAGCGTVRALAARVPVSTYEDVEPYVEASLRGEADALVRGAIQFFAMTAGTTGRRKALPITAAYRESFQATQDLFLYGLFREHPRALAGRVLFLPGSAEVDRAPSGVPMGAMSGHNFKSLPALVRRLYACPYLPFDVEDAQARAYCVARLALEHEVSFAVTISTQPLAYLGEVMERCADALLKDLAEGTLTPPGPLPAPLRTSLQGCVRRLPTRARHLSARAAQAGGLTPRVAWPELALLSCWAHAGGGAFWGSLRERWGDAPHRTAVYSATEGWFNVPLEDGVHDGVLAIDANVYEFIPLDGHGRPAGLPVPPTALREGDCYELVVSTPAGLWRYNMRDVVVCTGFFERTPRIQFVRKSGNVLSLAHDMTTETHVERAVRAVLGASAAQLRFGFGPAPVGEGPPHYLLLVASAGGELPATLERSFDQALREANLGYDQDRAEGALQPVRVRCIPWARFAAFDLRQMSTGAGAQAKPTSFFTQAEALASLEGHRDA